MNAQRRKNRLYAVTLFWLIVLGGTGLAQRWLRYAMESSATASVVLEEPLAALPREIGTWTGADVPVDARVAERAANDDHISRRYVEAAGDRFVDLFVAYTASPATMLGHRPDLCYPATGWRLESVRPQSLRRPEGKSLPCLIHRFTRGDGDQQGLVVLNYYVLQGKHTTDAEEFRGARWRRPSLARDYGFYVAQVQIVHPVYTTALFEKGEDMVCEFAKEIAGPIDRLLPLTDEARASRPEGSTVVLERQTALSKRN